MIAITNAAAAAIAMKPPTMPTIVSVLTSPNWQVTGGTIVDPASAWTCRNYMRSVHNNFWCKYFLPAAPLIKKRRNYCSGFSMYYQEIRALWLWKHWNFWKCFFTFWTSFSFTVFLKWPQRFKCMSPHRLSTGNDREKQMYESKILFSSTLHVPYYLPNILFEHPELCPIR